VLFRSAIIYAQNYSTVSSAIPAFSKRGDTIVADEGSSLSVQVGQQISRSNLHFFKHNDMADLRRVLEEIRDAEVRKNKKLSRKFIIVEGIYLNHGDIPPLPELVQLKEEFKYRLIVDESISFGVLGSRGAGLADHFDMPTKSIDIMIGSLTNSLGSSGGFVCGSREICEHQRLSGQAYTFSASLPAMLAVSASSALEIMSTDLALFEKLRENTRLFYTTLSKYLPGVVINGGVLADGSVVPMIFLRLKTRRPGEARVLQDICDVALKDGILISRAKFCEGQERGTDKMVPFIRVSISGGFTRKEIEKAALVLRDSWKNVMKKFSK